MRRRLFQRTLVADFRRKLEFRTGRMRESPSAVSLRRARVAARSNLDWSHRWTSEQIEAWLSGKCLRRLRKARCRPGSLFDMSDRRA